MGKRLLAALAAFVLMAGVVTACGGDDDDGVASPAELQAALDAFPAFMEGSPLIDEHCAPAANG